ncbi:MAG: flagellar motor switch protein FliN [Bryobacteraceae bacterium]|nr:flagellar motor switch protein FliN [Bryobacteraceae bacterium]
MADTQADTLRWLLDELAQQLALVFEMMTGQRPAIEIAGDAASAGNDFVWRQKLAGLAGAEILYAASEQSSESIGAAILKAAGVEQIDPAEVRSTFLEAVSQAVGGLARAASARVGRELSPSPPQAAAAHTAGVHWKHVAIHPREGEPATLLLFGFSPELVDSLRSRPEPAPLPAAAPAKTELEKTDSSRTFDLLLDVELPVRVSFGRAQVPLKEVLKLTTGSIVELNRSVSEPVEIIVNNCVVARGEVVVVEGNFGVRIQEVVSRQDRLRVLD